MIDLERVTESLPVVATAPVISYSVQLTPSDFEEVPYYPALLLPVSFDASLVADPEYQKGCEDGFDAYYDDLSYAIKCSATRRTVCGFVARNVFPCKDGGPLAWRAGFLHGWLSALALADRALAAVGMEMLRQLVALQLQGIALC